MLQPDEHLQFPWSCFTGTDSCLDDTAEMEPGFSLFNTIKDIPYEVISYSSTTFSDEVQCMQPSDFSSLNLEELETISSSEIEAMFGWLEEGETGSPSMQLSIEGDENWSFIPSMKSADASMVKNLELIEAFLNLPTEDTEMDNQLSIVHLVEAYAEAVEKGQTELVVVLVKRIQQKVSPAGEIVERLSYYLFQPTDNQANYLKQESARNFDLAFKAFYQIFPYARFAHFAANSAILEAMPLDAETIHIVDFNIGEGLQWYSLIEAIAQQHHKLVKLTSIKQREESLSCVSPASQWRFEVTKRHLYDHARSVGLKLKVEEMDLQGLMNEIKGMKKRGGRSEWLAFNCMVGLPHMGSTGRRQVTEFMRVANELMTAHSKNNRRGIIIFGDGECWETLKNSLTFRSFFKEYLGHYYALLESIEWTFPTHLAEARTAMECLFVAPHVSSLGWCQKWEEMKQGDDLCHVDPMLGLEGWRVSQESIMEAKQLVKEGQSEFGVQIEGKYMNEMILEWRGTQLVRVSAWR